MSPRRVRGPRAPGTATVAAEGELAPVAVRRGSFARVVIVVMVFVIRDDDVASVDFVMFRVGNGHGRDLLCVITIYRDLVRCNPQWCHFATNQGRQR